MTRILDRSLFLLICIIPLSLITGPFLPDLLISIAGLLFVINILISKEYFYLFNKFSLFFFIYCLFIIILSISSNNPYLSLESSLFYFRFGLLCLTINYIIDQEKKFTFYFFIILLSAFLILLIDGFYQYFTSYNFLGYHYGGNRLSGMFGEEQKLGTFLIRLLPLLLALASISKNYFFSSDYFLLFFTLLTGVMIFITGERSAIILYLIFSLCLGLIVLKNKKLKITFLFILFLSVFIMLSQTNIKQRVIINSFESFNFNNNSDTYFISKDHQGILLSSLRMFQQNIFTGIGPKMYRYECENEKYFIQLSNDENFISYCSTHPHNIYAQLFAETGVFGGLIISIIFLILFYLIVKESMINRSGSANNNNYKLLLLLALFMNIVPFVPSYNFFNNWISIVYYLPVGFLMNFYLYYIKDEVIN